MSWVRDRIAERDALLIRMAEQGYTRKQAASEIGVSYVTIHVSARRLGIKFKQEWSCGKGCRDKDRAEVMAGMYKAGKTLEEIGQVYGITRERVRQIMTRHLGITGKDGGKSFLADINRQKREAKREAKYQRKFGWSFAEHQALVAYGKKMRSEGSGHYRCPVAAFNCQRQNAKVRDIEWRLNLAQWWSLWERSGKWGERGRGKDKFVMCRFGDNGAYEIGNVYIATLSHNSTIQPNNPYRVGHPNFETAMAEKMARRASMQEAA